MRLLLKNAMIYAPAGVIESGFIAVNGDTIESVGTKRPAGEFDSEKDMSGKLLLPGLVNCHTHASMTLLRGVGTDLPLQKWLFDEIFPVEAKMTEADIAVGAELAMLEMLACGTTGFSDMYFSSDLLADTVCRSGMKANICQHVQAFDASDRYNNNEYARKMERLHRNWHGKGNGRIRVDACLHGEYTCLSEEVARGVAGFAKDNHLRMHIHMSETAAEHEECKARRGGLTPAEWFNKMGVFDVPCAAAHCVWVSEGDMALMAEKGVTAVHNPSSNMKLGSGFAPVPDMVARGIRVALGTDGTASNNNLNMMEELHLASVIHNGHRCDATLLPAAAMLQMATRNGALTQGRDDTGVLEAGKKADIIAIDMDKPHLYPCLDAAGLITYAVQGSDVCLTMVDGKILYENGAYLTLDREKIMAEAKAVVKRLYQ